MRALGETEARRLVCSAADGGQARLKTVSSLRLERNPQNLWNSPDSTAL